MQPKIAKEAKYPYGFEFNFGKRDCTTAKPLVA
jgi:hypothetical protein